MATRTTLSAVQSKLLEVPAHSDPKQAFLIVQQNFDIVWKALKDVISWINQQPK